MTTSIDTTNTADMIEVVRHAMNNAVRLGADREAWLRKGRAEAARHPRKPGGFAHAQQVARIAAYDALIAA